MVASIHVTNTISSTLRNCFKSNPTCNCVTNINNFNFLVKLYPLMFYFFFFFVWTYGYIFLFWLAHLKHVTKCFNFFYWIFQFEMLFHGWWYLYFNFLFRVECPNGNGLGWPCQKESTGDNLKIYIYMKFYWKYDTKMVSEIKIKMKVQKWKAKIKEKVSSKTYVPKITKQQ